MTSWAIVYCPSFHSSTRSQSSSATHLTHVRFPWLNFGKRRFFINRWQLKIYEQNARSTRQMFDLRISNISILISDIQYLDYFAFGKCKHSVWYPPHQLHELHRPWRLHTVIMFPLFWNTLPEGEVVADTRLTLHTEMMYLLVMFEQLSKALGTQWHNGPRC